MCLNRTTSLLELYGLIKNNLSKNICLLGFRWRVVARIFYKLCLIVLNLRVSTIDTHAPPDVRSRSRAHQCVCAYMCVSLSFYVCVSLSLCACVCVYCVRREWGGRGGPLTDVVLGDDAVVAQQQHVAEVQRAARTAQQQVLARVRAQQRHLYVTARTVGGSFHFWIYCNLKHCFYI